MGIKQNWESQTCAGAFGLKYKPSLLNEIGVAYELPLTDERGVLQHRFTADYILRY